MDIISFEEVLWDRQAQERTARSEAFRFMARIGRRSNDRVVRSAMKTRILRRDNLLEILGEGPDCLLLMAHEQALREAAREIFGTTCAVTIANRANGEKCTAA